MLASGTHSGAARESDGDSRLNVHADLSFVALIMQASFVVQAVVALLILLSLWSWWQIFLKLFQLRRAARDTDAFEDEFWKGGDLADLYQRTAQADRQRHGTHLHRRLSRIRQASQARQRIGGDARLGTAGDARRVPA